MSSLATDHPRIPGGLVVAEGDDVVGVAVDALPRKSEPG
jgi:hypothetical protein